MAIRTALDDAINLSVVPDTAIAPIDRVKNVIYFCNPKSGVTDPFVIIDNPDDIAAKTDDLGAQVLFDNGLNRIILALAGNNVDWVVLSQYAYTVIVSNALVDQTPDFSGFDGYKVYQVGTDTTANATLAAGEKNIVILTATAEFLSCALMARFVTQNIFTDMQYADFTGYPVATASIGQVDDYRTKGYTFLFKDATTVTSPKLWNFKGGLLPVADGYIVEQLRQDIQTTLFEYIANNQPRYLNSAINTMVTLGEKIILQYKNLFLIESGTFTIAPREDQIPSNIPVGLVQFAVVDLSLSGSIWRLEGTIQTNYN